LLTTWKITGLDLEFSYPAALTFLEKFKSMCENIETFGYPIIKFPYEKKDDMRVEVCIAGIDDGPIPSLTGISSHIHAVETRLIK
jgi:hypothetical protein